MRCRKNVVLNTRCGCISASPAFDPGGKINHLFEKTTTPTTWKKKKRDSSYFYFLLWQELVLLEERVAGLSHCHGAWHVAAESKYWNQQVRFLCELMAFFKILIRSKTTSLWIKVIKKANYRCQDSWKRAEPDKSQRQMTVNKSAGSKR